MLVTKKSYVRIGKNVRIKKSAQIGASGFGFEKENDSYKIPLVRRSHPKIVVIGDNVEIGDNTVIHRGRWCNTVIGEGCKLDSLVHVAHNVIMGKHNLVVAGTVIGGSVTIGDRVFLGMNCSIKQGVTIGNDVIVGAGAVVLHDVPDGLTVAGVPAKPIKSKPPQKTK